MAQRTPAYRISSAVVMNTKRRPRTSSGDSKGERSKSSAISDEIFSGVQEVEEKEVHLAGPADEGFEDWSPVAGDEGDVPIEELLLGDDEEEAPLDDEEILLEEEFDEDSDDLNVEGVFEGDDEAEDDEAEDVDEEEDEESFEEDEELAAQASSGEFEEDDVPIPRVRKRRGHRVSSRGTAALDDMDDSENIDASEDILDPLADGFEPVFDVGDSGSHEATGPLTSLEDEQGTEEFDEESAEDIRNAANILSESGILGIGLGEVEADDISQSPAKSGTLPDSDLTAVDEQLSEDDLDFEKLLGYDDGSEAKEEDDDEEVDDEPRDTEDVDADYDDEYTLTTESSVGKVWELNEDTYVTITQPGQAYPYELDEEDEEDQEMSTVRRGKQGGWSGGLASYPASSELPVGSKEWIARRSYELIAESSPVEMFRWTKRHLNAPPLIDDLYPDERPEPVPLGKQTLKLSAPNTAASITGTGFFQEKHNEAETGKAMTPTKNEARNAEGLVDDKVEKVLESTNVSGSEEEKKKRGQDDPFEKDRSALDRSISFPYVYKFKIEGSGEGFPECVQDIVRNTLGRDIEDLPLAVERSGRYGRVEFNLTLENSKEITDLFDALRTDARIKRSYG